MGTWTLWDLGFVLKWLQYMSPHQLAYDTGFLQKCPECGATPIRATISNMQKRAMSKVDIGSYIVIIGPLLPRASKSLESRSIFSIIPRTPRRFKDYSIIKPYTYGLCLYPCYVEKVF